MLRFCTNLSLLFTEMQLKNRFRAARKQGFSAVEIQFPYEMSVDDIKDELQRHHLKLVLFNVDADDLLHGGEGLACVPEKQNRFQDAVGQAFQYAEKLKPFAINILPGRCLDNDRRTEYLDTFKKNLRFAADTFAPLGIKTVFEAINSHDMPGFLVDSGEQMLSIWYELNHPDLFLQYDIYHMHRMGENPVDFISSHADIIGHIQFADCPGRGQPGTGLIDFDRIFAAIDQSAYSGWIGAEYKPVGTTSQSFNWLFTQSYCLP